MELDAFDGWSRSLVTEAHHHAVLEPCGDRPVCGDRLTFDDQRVVSRRLKRIRQTVEHALIVVMYRRRLAMNRNLAPVDDHAMKIPDGLVAQADAENWDAASEPINDGSAHARFFGRTGSR